MAETHVIQQGETLSSVALGHGFRNFRTILNHPQNAALKASRDPHVLFPGDKVFIPDLKPKTVDGATEKLHRFVLATSPLFLRLRLLDIDGKPLANTPCDVGLTSGQPPDDETTDAQGILEEPVTANIRKGEVVAHVPPKKTKPNNPPPTVEQKVKFDLRIGSLNPESKLSGQQARLNNLGYFAGYAVKDLDQLLWAAEEFACDKISKPVTKRPKIAPAPPQGEDNADNSNPTKPTGVLDDNIVKKLKLEHGI